MAKTNSQEPRTSVTELKQWLPHRPPMVWVDAVLSHSVSGGVTETAVNEDSLFLSDKAVAPIFLLEIMAQSYGFVRVLQVLSELLPKQDVPKNTFLANVRNAEFFVTELSPELQVGAVIRTVVESGRSFGPLTVAKVRCESLEGRCLARAELKVFSE